MTQRRLVAGVDSSTQSTKVLLVDAETGQIVARRDAPHPDGTAIDPEHWWRALETAVDGHFDPNPRKRHELGLLDQAAAISVSAQQHGMVALDAAGTPVYDALLWNDVRSAPQARQLRELHDSHWWATELGVVPVPSFTSTKLAWLARTHPDLAARIDSVLLPHDWLSWRLRSCDGPPSTDRSDASGTGYYSVPGDTYREDLVETILGHLPTLPTVLRPSEWAGTTRTGVPIAAGCGDNAGAALGLGIREGDVVISIGTSGTVFTTTPNPVCDPTGTVAGFADAAGGNLPLLATLNAARVFDATATMLGVDLHQFDQLAQAGPPDAGGLVMVPYLDGERTPDLPDATGIIAGVTRRNMTPENMARAAVLGVLHALRDALDSLRAVGVPLEHALLIGGGARSGAVRRAAAQVFQMPVTVPMPEEYVALGSARQAAWALSGAAEPPTWTTRIDEVIEPRTETWSATARDRFVTARRASYGR
ncbi:xylulokinase [Nocardia carnea]|uniref:Xylulose kinase n=1 Tax=Nocardia carnea TaxID=37328 RepID=A0ABW7TR66_9NOCA|nr:xylulokinase [Nocardia carnea]